MKKLARRLFTALGLAAALVTGTAAPTLAQAQVLRVDTAEHPANDRQGLWPALKTQANG